MFIPLLLNLNALLFSSSFCTINGTLSVFLKRTSFRVENMLLLVVYFPVALK